MNPEIPAFGSYNPQQAQTNLTQDVANLAPLATHYSGAQSGVAVQYNAPAPVSSGSNLDKFTHFLGGLASQTGSIAEGAGKWLGTQIKSAVTAPIRYGEGISQGIQDRSTLAGIDAQNADLTAKMDNLNLQYKSGKISSQQYKTGLADINQDFANQVRQAQAINTKVKADQTNAQQATLDTAGLLTTILTAGFGKAAATEVTAGGLKATDVVTAGQFLKGKAAEAYLGPVENAIGKIAGDSKVFNALSDTAKNAIQKATAEVVSTGANMSKGDIARATAANLALKSPIYYNLISKTGDQLYTELQDHKYGAAVNTLAFNAALVLSGGPIGQALKYLGKFGKGVTGAVFGRTSFLDTVDKELFGGKGKLYAALKSDPEAAQAFSNLRATQLSATGADEVAGAYRLINGERALAGNNYVAQGPEAWMNHLKDWNSTQKAFSDTAKRLGMGNVVMAPWTANTVNFISEHLAQFPKDQWESAFKDLQDQYPNSAWSNNQNVIGSIEHAISSSGDNTELLGSIKSIDAGKYQSGFPKAMLQDAAKKGFVPIEAPAGAQVFHEGEGALATKFHEGSDQFFTHAVQPLPVLGTVGSLLRGAGLSPEASSVRTNQIFQENLKANLANVSAVKQFASSDGEVDDLVKKLSSYAHDPTRRFISGAPVTDFRQLTNKDVRTALSVTRSQATEIQKAISSAHLQIDTAVKGLGDKAVDLAYSAKGLNVLTKRFLKTQGVLRFGANPFFQYLRVIPKTEILSASEGGGFIKTLWNGQAKELNQVRTTLRTNGLLDETGHIGNVTGAEGAEQVGEGLSTTSKTLSKKLLPTQEKSIAGIVIDQAKRMGMNTDDYITQFPDKVGDTIQAIAEYDKKSSFLNSPLARTLNVAVFPFRFDAKVLSIMGRNLGKANLGTQVAFIKGMMGAHDWLNSDQGKAWYQQNADAIGLFKYITPFANFNEIFHSLLPGNDHSLGNFGQLGGLPFGWIPSLLDSEGLTQFNQPGVDPKTGQTFTKYIPKDARGQVATAIQDMISGMFSYPGATVGLPSKNKATLGISEGLTGASAKDFTKIAGSGGTQAVQPAQPSSSIVPSVTVAAQPTPANQVLPKSSSPTAKKKKKSEFVPQLLPGQTQIGQL